MVLPTPKPTLSDFLTPEQLDQLAVAIDQTMQTHGRFEVMLKFDKMGLKYIETRTSVIAPVGDPPFIAKRARYNGNGRKPEDSTNTVEN